MSELSEPTVQRFRKIRLVKNSKVIDKGKYNGTPHYWPVLYLGYNRLPEKTVIQEQSYFLEINGKGLGETQDRPWGLNPFCLTKMLFLYS